MKFEIFKFLLEKMRLQTDIRIFEPNVIDTKRNYVVVLDLDGYIIGYDAWLDNNYT